MTRTTTASPRLAAGMGLALAGLLGSAACGQSADADALGPDAVASTRPAASTAPPTASTAPSEAAPTASPTESPTPTETATTTTDPAPAATGSSSPAQPQADGDDGADELDELPAGTHHGYIESLDQTTSDGHRVAVLGFDKADLLTGEEAVAAARAAGAIGPEETSVPNDAYVSNVNPLVRRLAVADGAPVRVLVGGSSDLSAADLTAAADAGSLFEVTVTEVDGLSRVTSVTAVYLP